MTAVRNRDPVRGSRPVVVRPQRGDQIAQVVRVGDLRRTEPSSNVAPCGPVSESSRIAVNALRQTIGADALFRLLREWIRAHTGGNVTIAQSTAPAEQISGRDLDGFFHIWLVHEGQAARDHDPPPVCGGGVIGRSWRWSRADVDGR